MSALRDCTALLQKLFSQEKPPSWWPLEKWDSSQMDSKAKCQKVFAAMRLYYGVGE